MVYWQRIPTPWQSFSCQQNQDAPGGPVPAFCGISVPCGFAKSGRRGDTDSSRGEVNGIQRGTDRGSRNLSELPIGLQILGKALDEARDLSDRARLRTKHRLTQSASEVVGLLATDREINGLSLLVL